MSDSAKHQNTETYEAAVKKGVNDCDLHLSEIPDLDLYIDQILTLVANKTEAASEKYR